MPIGEGGARPEVALTMPRFVAPEGRHGWLNHAVLVAALVADPADPGIVRIGVFRMV